MRTTLTMIMAIISMAITAQNKALDSFESIMSTLKQGNSVNAVFYYKDCQLISDNEISERQIDAIGGMKITTWEYFAEGAIRNKEAFVVASTSNLIANPIGEGFVYNYVKVKISASNKVRITAKYLDTNTMEEVMTENFFTSINNGKEGAAHFFTKR